MDPYECRVLADSASPGGVRLTTLLVCFPRFILAEFNTHRMFSRSSASSRAVPVAKRIAACRAAPFVPEAFGRNRPGMQAAEDLDAAATELARDQWLTAAEAACVHAEKLSLAGVHKQHANRLLEPFLWHEAVVTATDWDNFWHLRVSAHAQPEMRRTAEAMLDVYNLNSPDPLLPGEWHLPFIDPDDWREAERTADGDLGAHLARISVARCARVSYLTHDGRRDHAEDLRLHDQLLENGHMSPFEHAAAVGSEGYLGTFLVNTLRGTGPFVGNFRAPWVQYRKTLDREADRLAPVPA